MKGTLGKILAPLDGLFTETGHDWLLSLHHTLTEPTCPTAIITPEGWSISRYRVDCDSIEESLQTVVALVHKEVIERKPVGHYAPITDRDDDAYARWLYARAEGSNDHLGQSPRDPLPEGFGEYIDSLIGKGFTEDAKTEGIQYMGSYMAARAGYHFPDARIDMTEARKLIKEKLKAIGWK